MSDLLYNNFKAGLLRGRFDLEKEVVKVLLVTSGYRFNQSHISAKDIVGEISGEGYKESGQVLTGKKVSIDTNGEAVFTADDLTLEKIKAGTITGLVVCVWRENREDSPLVAFVDSKEIFPIVTNGGDLIIKWPQAGIIKIK